MSEKELLPPMIRVELDLLRDHAISLLESKADEAKLILNKALEEISNDPGPLIQSAKRKLEAEFLKLIGHAIEKALNTHELTEAVEKATEAAVSAFVRRVIELQKGGEEK